MASEQFCLRWNDFHANITSAFSDIRDDDEFMDVTLVCDGDIVRAHKLVLSACSPLFRVMLKKNSHPHPMIFLRGIRFPDMVAILNFMYHGEVNVNQEDLQMFLAASEELRIKGLSQASNDSKMEKLDNAVPKKKMISSVTPVPMGQPPVKKVRESSPVGGSPASSGPGSARSPGLDQCSTQEEEEGPQLSVKREFAMARDNLSKHEEDEDSSQGQGNLLDCLMQAGQSYANFQQQQQQQVASSQANSTSSYDQNSINNYNSPQHIIAGGGSSSLSQTSDNKGLLQFLGQNSANVSSAAANAIMMQRLLGTGYELHPLGSRKDNDPLSHIKVARSSKGWHCPQCIHISSTKGNLKSHILSGRHKTYTEKPFGCQYCDRSYGTKQSLQVHISTNHRAERDAEYQALSKSLGMKSFPEGAAAYYQGAIKSEQYDMSSWPSPAALTHIQQMQNKSGAASPSHLNLVRNFRNQIEAAAINTNGGTKPALSVAPVGLAANLSSCRLEARGDDVEAKVMEIRNHINAYQGSMEDEMDDDPPALTLQTPVDGGYTTQTLAMAEDEEEEEEQPLAMASVEASMDTSITTP